MSDAEPPASRYQRGEGASRRAVLLVGSGVLAFVLGSYLMSGLAVRLGERLGGLGSGPLASVGHWVLLRTWLWAVLPFFGWAAGRYVQARPVRFAVTAVLSGEVFGLLLATAGDELDWVFGGPAQWAIRLLTLVAGGALAAWAVRRGSRAADRAQAAALAEADRRKTEYADFVARASEPPESSSKPSEQ